MEQKERAALCKSAVLSERIIMNEEKNLPRRDTVIIRASIIGIVANILLSAFKAFVGIVTNSIAITLDAVNNISDAASSVITIVGTKLAAKQPDKKHPFGYGRMEYLSAMVISGLVLYAGITSLVESIKKIIAPETPDYSTASLLIVGAAVVVKILLGRYVTAVGKKVNSDSLVNSGKDATLDSVISASTLAAAAVFLLWHVSLEAYLGALISLLIIKSGVEMLRDTLSKILGEKADPQLTVAIKKTVSSFPEVLGAYDLILHNYGPDSYQGSVHIEIDDTCTAAQIDELTRSIYEKVYEEHRVYLTSVSIYSSNATNEKAVEMRKIIRDAVLHIENVRGVHGFYLQEAQKKIRFDIVISFNAKNRLAVYNEAMDAVRALYPDYDITVSMDGDFSEL